MDSGFAFGFGIDPVHVFGESDASSLSELTIVPTTTGTVSCSVSVLHPNRERLERYAIGNLIALQVGPYNAEDPDVMYGVPGFTLDVIHESCDLEKIGRSQRAWNVPRQCGLIYFHAKALAAAFDSCSESAAELIDDLGKQLLHREYCYVSHDKWAENASDEVLQ